MLGRVAGNSVPRGESFHLFPSPTWSLVLLTSNFTGSGSTEDVSFRMHLHVSNWILWPWLASLGTLTINKPTCVARTPFFYRSKPIFGEVRAFQHLLLLSTPQPIAQTASREWKRCTALSPKNKITSLCFKVFCKVSAQGEPHWLQHLTDSSLSSMPFVSLHLTPLIHCNWNSIRKKKKSADSESACLNRISSSLLLPRNPEVLILEQNPDPAPRKRVIFPLIFPVCFKKTGF